MEKKINFQKSLPFLILTVFFIIGINIYDDYGISWDEYYQRINELTIKCLIDSH